MTRLIYWSKKRLFAWNTFAIDEYDKLIRTCFISFWNLRIWAFHVNCKLTHVSFKKELLKLSTWHTLLTSTDQFWGQSTSNDDISQLACLLKILNDPFQKHKQKKQKSEWSMSTISIVSSFSLVTLCCPQDPISNEEFFEGCKNPQVGRIWLLISESPNNRVLLGSCACLLKEMTIEKIWE